MVRTFEVEAGALVRSWTDASLAEASARLPPGSYTSLRTWGGSRVVRLQQHLARLEESLVLQGLPPARVPEAEARRALAAALAECGQPESRLRLTFCPPRLFVSVEPFVPLPPSLYLQGAWCVCLPLERANPRAKDTRFIARSAAAYARLPAGAHEGLLLGPAGEVLEGLSSNFFAVSRGVLRSEDARALHGVTRGQVLELARDLLPVSLEPVRKAELDALDEAFLTSASRGVLPVTRVDAVEIGDGRRGRVSLELGRRLERLLEREAESLVG